MYYYYLILFTPILYYFFNFYKKINHEPILIIKKTHNLYENWVKKPEMRNILSVTKDLQKTIIFDNLITIFIYKYIYPISFIYCLYVSDKVVTRNDARALRVIWETGEC